MPVSNEQLYNYLQGLRVSEKEWRDEVLVLLADIKKTGVLQVSGRESYRETVGISQYTPIILDYRDRKHVYLWSANALTLSLGDLGTLPVSANTWTDISFREGLYITVPAQGATIAYVTVVQTDQTIAAASSSGGSGGGGTQYTDGGTPPANPIGNALVFDNSGAWADVGTDAPMPVSLSSLPALSAGLATIGSVNIANANANGQAIMTGSSPVVIASDQSKLPVKASSGDFPAGSITDLATVAGAITAAIMQANISKVGGNSIAVGSNAMPTLISAAQGYVSAFGSNAANLTANTDYTFKWGAGGTTQVNHVMVFNNTAINILWDEDVATSAGSPLILPGQYLFLDVQTTIFHIQGNGTNAVNGAAANNVIIRGWL